MPDRITTREITVVIGILAVAWSVYVYGALNSPVFNSELAARRDYLARFEKSPDVDLATEQRLADDYWKRNPDVEADSAFGRNGRMGVFGAREHYNRHGRQEGRAWGDSTP